MGSTFRQAVRALAARPAFTAVVAATLAVAIGANATIFSVLYAVVLRPLPYPEPGNLVAVWESNREQAQDRVEVSGLTFLDWQDRQTTLASMGAWRYRGFTMTGGPQAERVTSVEASPGVFATLGVAAAHGRVLLPADAEPGNERQVVMSAGAWARRFGSDPAAVGATVQFDDQNYTIVGVMPADFQFPPADPSVEFWSPLVLTPGTQPSRPHRMYQTIGRIAPGASMAAVQADFDAVAAGIAREHPDSNAGWGAAVVSAHAQTVGDVGSTLWLLSAAVGLVLLIACANIANLLLARSSAAGRDIALCAALGASRAALVRRSILESGLLAALGGTAGLLLAWWGATALRQVVPPTMPRADEVGLDWPVVGFAAVATIGAAVLFGLVPAWRAMRPNLMVLLQTSSRGSSGSARARRAVNALVVAEVALALVLFVGAGLLLRSFVRLTAVDPGFRTSGVTAIHLALPAARYGPAALKKQFFDELTTRLRSLQGVRSAGAVSALPMSPIGLDFDLPFTIDGLEATSPAERPRANYRGVISGYFETMGIRLVEGRLFTDFDGRDGGPRVAVVNETAVRRYFPDRSPIDRVIRMPMAGDLTIVGVVADVRHYGLDATSEVEVFVPYGQFALSEMHVVIETDPAAGPVAPAFRALVGGIDPAVPVGRVTTIDRLMADATAEPRFNTALVLGLAVTAGLLALIGVYGVVTYAVSQRTTEIGLRMALGADAGRTFRQVVGGALKVVSAGVVVGLAGAAVAGASIERLLFGVEPFDPMTFAASAAVVLALGGVAASLPASRAARVDPVSALRQE